MIRERFVILAAALCMATCTAMLLSGVSVAAATPAITEFPVPSHGTSPVHTTLGPDGNVWFTEDSSIDSVVQNVGRITPAGNITEFSVGTRYPGLRGITAGPDGAVWFTEERAAKIGRITLSGQITEFPLPRSDAYPHSITTGPDGALWFTENGRIGRITTLGVLREFTVSQTTPYYLQEITAGPDGALWFADESASAIGRITTRGKLSSYPVTARGPNWNPTPVGMAAGSDGAIWFTLLGQDQIGRITTQGVITQYDFPNWNPNNTVGPTIITAGPDGALWFTESAGRIGRITTSGAVSEYPVTSQQPSLAGICSGADGALWFAEHGELSGHKIGRLQPDPAPPVVSAITPTSGDAAGGTTVTVRGFGFTAKSVVRFGTTRARSVSFVSANELTVTSPALPSGVHQVRIVTAYGTSDPSSKGRYTAVSAR